MKTLTNFALKSEHKYLQSVEDIFFEIDFLIAWKSFRIIFESMYFNKKVL
jgi:hypothetical protein